MSPLKSNYLLLLEREASSGKIPKKILMGLHQVYLNYAEAFEQLDEEIASFEPLLETFLEMVMQQIETPFTFSPYHEQVTKPFDHYQFGLDFMRPLFIEEESTIVHPEQIATIEAQLANGENVILLANHQAEPDPQAISFLLEEEHSELARTMIFVAGHRVTQDPSAIPFSLGRNLLCIYSKKHIDTPSEEKERKQKHNQKTMHKMSELLSEGGKCIYVAPSGGRDRPNAEGVVDVTEFDPQSVEMFRLMAKRATKKTHFYPLALETYHWFPPPSSVEKELGEQRPAHRSGVQIAFGKELDMETFPGCNVPDKKERRHNLAHHIWSQVRTLYWDHHT